MKLKLSLIVFSVFFIGDLTGYSQDSQKPNVILIITDDQGYGDLGFTGNPHVKTPTIDALASKSIRFNNFYVSPVCAPTRSSLMTGRYSLRTGVRDTYNGGATMATNEVTIAEVLQNANYKTGMFGKWHLGDNYPHRPMDQGFDESVMHLSGGMGQVGDFTTYFKRERSYFDPVLWRNGQQKEYKGYCSDIFTNEAINFIETNKETPFFCYLSFNAPHTPLQVPDSYYEMYKDIDPSKGFEQDGRPFPEMTEKNKEDARKVYAMVSNIDDNIKKLLEKLEDLRIRENTVVIFMTDNGPQQPRYVAGMKGRKGSVYRGGVRVPFYLNYEKMNIQKQDINTTTAHIDVFPTIAEICQVDLPKNGSHIDGESMVSIFHDDSAAFEERSLFFYWTRRFPELYQNMAIQRGDYKLVGMTDYNAPIHKFQLYDLSNDPYEQHNIISKQLNVADRLRVELDKKYEELIRSKNLIDPPRIEVGSAHENPVFLNRNDAGGERGIWAQEEIYGKWGVHIHEGVYNIQFKFIKPIPKGGKMFLETGNVIHQFKNDKDQVDLLEMNDVQLDEMTCDLIPFYMVNSKKIFPFWVEIQKEQ